MYSVDTIGVLTIACGHGGGDVGENGSAAYSSSYVLRGGRTDFSSSEAKD